MTTVDASMLSRAWRDWADRLAVLGVDDWATSTRCDGWTVHDLAAHVAPDPNALDGLQGAVLDTSPKVDDAATLLGMFNTTGGVARTHASYVAEAARVAARALTGDDLIERFIAGARIVESQRLAPSAVVPHPVVGSVTVAVLTDISVMEATVHLLDLLDVIEGPPPASEALDRVRDLLSRVTDPTLFIEAATGRTPCTAAFPAIR